MLRRKFDKQRFKTVALEYGIAGLIFITAFAVAYLLLEVIPRAEYPFTEVGLLGVSLALTVAVFMPSSQPANSHKLAWLSIAAIIAPTVGALTNHELWAGPLGWVPILEISLVLAAAAALVLIAGARPDADARARVAVSWEVDWPSVSTPLSLLLLIVTQITWQLERARDAARALLAEDGNHQERVATLLYYGASAADAFWPSAGRRKRLALEFPFRGRDLRHVLGIEGEQPSMLDFIRNDLVHVDERLEEVYLDSGGEALSLTAWAKSMPNSADTLVFMAYLPERKVLHSLGKELDVEAFAEWCDDVIRRLERVTMPLLLKSGRQRATAEAGPQDPTDKR